MSQKLIRERAPNGAEIVRVPTTNRSDVFVTLDAEDWDSLVAAGYPKLILNSSQPAGEANPRYQYVRVAGAWLVGRLQTAARLITGANAGQIVRYADGDRLNLRRSNLFLQTGWACRKGDQVKPGTAAEALDGLKDQLGMALYRELRALQPEAQRERVDQLLRDSGAKVDGLRAEITGTETRLAALRTVADRVALAA